MEASVRHPWFAWSDVSRLAFLDVRSYPAGQIATALCLAWLLGVFLFAFDYARPAWMITGWIAAILAFAFAPKAVSKTRLALVGVIVVSAYMSVLFSHLLDTGPLSFNLSLAIWLTPLTLLAFIRPPSLALVWAMLTPLSLVQSGAVIYQGLFLKMFRPSGFMDSPNPAASFLVLAAVYFLYTKRMRWLAVPCVAAVAYTGSRLALLVLAVMLLGLFIQSRPSTRFIVLTAVVVGLLIWPSYNAVKESARASYVPALLDAEKGGRLSITKRLTLERQINGLPNGVTAHGEGPPHNVPLRLAMELGIPAAAAWVLLSLRGLRRNRGLALWMLAAVLLMGMLDYYVLFGPLGAFWWVLIARHETGGRVIRDLYDKDGRITGRVHKGG